MQKTFFTMDSERIAMAAHRHGDLSVALACLPPVVAGYFIAIHATAMPLTDEWLLVYNAMIMDAAPATAEGVLAAFAEMRQFIAGHFIVIPNLLYLTIAPWVEYDARVFIFFTLACNALLLFCAGSRGLRGIALIAASVLVFSPARYMEMMWGFQFTMGLSVLLGAVGLTLFDVADGHRRRRLMLGGGFLAIFLGLLCSSPALFALPAAAIRIQNPRLKTLRRDGIFVIVPACLLALVYFYGPGGFVAELARMVLFVLTAIGSLFLGSPDGLLHFTLNIRSGLGLMVLGLDAAMIFHAYRGGSLARLNYGLTMITYGLLALLAVPVVRPYLGNWHLQFGVPFIVGSFWLAGQYLCDRAGAFRIARGGIVLAACMAVPGYWYGFTDGGPWYEAYRERVLEHLLALPGNPLLPKPYPPTKGWDASPDLVRFLENTGNPAFAGINR